MTLLVDPADFHYPLIVCRALTSPGRGAHSLIHPGPLLRAHTLLSRVWPDQFKGPAAERHRRQVDVGNRHRVNTSTTARRTKDVQQ